MASTSYDLLFVADPRFEGGSSTAMAVEMEEAARMGLRCGLLIVRGPIIRHPLPIHPAIRGLLDDGAIDRVDPEVPVHAAVVLLHHPSILKHPLSPRPKVLAGRVVIILHHPLQDALGVPQYELPTIVRHASMAFDSQANVMLAPVSTVVRQGLPWQLPEGAVLTQGDWTNLLDLSQFPPRGPRVAGADQFIIGRHARPDRKKWPDLAKTAYASLPTPDNWRVRALGADPALLAHYGPLPQKWELLPFNAVPVAEFLRGLDAWVYFHADEWVEAFGRTALEAMASGVPVVLAPHFRPLFADAALYCQPDEVEAVLRHLADDPLAWSRQAQAGRAFAERNHDAGLFAARIQPLLTDRPAQRRVEHLPDATVLFLSSNGIGMGHLVQQLAIADRLPLGLTPVFATMSYAAQLARKAGYATEFLPGHRNGGFPHEEWNLQFGEHLLDLLTRLRPRVVMYDATAAFDGVLRALATYDEAFTVWVRRAMWQECHRMFLPALWSFDAVIEPGELAEALDTGPTVEQRPFVYRVAPVLHIDPEARMTRTLARQAMGLPDAASVIGVQLGGGNNFPLADLRQRLLADLLARPGVIVVEIISPINTGGTAPRPVADNHRIMPLFPMFRFSAGFDGMISAAGYNAYHELVLGQVPTIFVPNEGPEMDLQVNRAIWADLAGVGMICRRDLHQPRLKALLDRLLDPDEASAIRRRAAALRLPPYDAVDQAAVRRPRNGAQEIADFVEDHARLLRADRPAGLRF
jgi:glycosyltransferase involved in cell wall biosynthesis/UDP:flavonoid glycosyltransferase YjiC (YdhE family)